MGKTVAISDKTHRDLRDLKNDWEKDNMDKLIEALVENVESGIRVRHIYPQ